jgi:predicted enzyme related to lactoylglutathione lyase
MNTADRWFRTKPNSSVLARPRLLARLLIDVADLDDRIDFYQRILGVAADLRMPIPDFGGLELAAVGNVLLIGSARPFTPMQRRTAYSLIVPSLKGQLRVLERLGTTVLEPPETIVPGSRARVRYADGAIAELVEHRPRPGEQPRPNPRRVTPTGVRLLARRAVPTADFNAAVAHYEAALQTPATVRAASHPETGARLAVVGELLIVGSDELSAEAFAFALIAPPGAATRQVGAAVGHGRAVANLVGDVRAEIWDERVLDQVSETVRMPSFRPLAVNGHARNPDKGEQTYTQRK